MKVEYAVFAAILGLFLANSFCLCIAIEPECNSDLLVNVTSSQVEVSRELALARSTSWLLDAVEHYNSALNHCNSAKLQQDILRELALVRIFQAQLSKAESCCLVDIPNLDDVSRANRTLDLASVRYLQGRKIEAITLVDQARPILFKIQGEKVTLPLSELLWAKAEALLNSTRQIDYPDYAFEAIRFQKNLLGRVDSSWLRRLSEFYTSNEQFADLHVARNLLTEALSIDLSCKSPDAAKLVLLDKQLLQVLETKKRNSKPIKSNHADICVIRSPLIDWSNTETKEFASLTR